MATKTNTITVAATERDQVAAQITAQLLEALNAPREPKESITKRLMKFAGDQLAEAKEGLGYISAGWEAAENNYRITRESERTRQQLRTAEKMAQLVEQQLKLKGL